MKKKTSFVLLFGLLLFSARLFGMEDQQFPHFRSGRIKVQYQVQRPGSPSWTSFSTTVTDARTVNMVKNQLMQRHPGCRVRLLSASADRDVQAVVRYQIRRGKSSWTTCSTTLRNALTESMARNQISARYPGAEVRILSLVFK